MPDLQIVIQAPAGTNVPVLISDLQSWLRTRGAELGTWRRLPELDAGEEHGPIEGK